MTAVSDGVNQREVLDMPDEFAIAVPKVSQYQVTLAMYAYKSNRIRSITLGSHAPFFQFFDPSFSIQSPARSLPIHSSTLKPRSS